MPADSVHYRARGHRPYTCNDQVIGAILSGWRYDISGIPKDLRGDYEAHLRECDHCRRRQHIHRTVDVLLLVVTTLSFVAFLLATLVIRRLESFIQVTNVHLHLHGQGNVALMAHLPASVTISLQAVAIAGVFVSMLLWVLVAIATPIAGMVSHMVRERFSPELSERKHAA